jgi:hypothetical protein
MRLIRILFGFRRSPLRRGRYSEEVLFASWVDLPAAFREIITRR